MAFTPDEIRNQSFDVVRKGYDRGEVRRYLDQVANQLVEFNAAMATSSAATAEPVDATIVAEPEPVAPPEPQAAPEPVAPAPEPEPAPEFAAVVETASTSSFSDGDNFDRMGNEISLMLRQAQESALKIRSDAEIEARTLIDQVKLDIEADRSAHESAASELVARTEQRANEMRAEAEAYAVDTRAAADADRTLAAQKLEDASREAEARIAESRAAAIADSKLAIEQANATMSGFVTAERDSRASLEAARNAIESALAQLNISEIEIPTPSFDD